MAGGFSNGFSNGFDVGAGGTTVTPTTATLTLTEFAPTVTAISEPTALSAAPLSSSSILVDWSHPGGAVYFELQRRVKAS